MFINHDDWHGLIKSGSFYSFEMFTMAKLSNEINRFVLLIAKLNRLSFLACKFVDFGTGKCRDRLLLSKDILFFW